MDKNYWECITCGKWVESYNPVEIANKNLGALCNSCKLKSKEKELKELSEYFGTPVRPLFVFCNAIREWAECIKQGVKDNPTKEWQQGSEYADLLQKVLTDVQKSGLLWRILYCNQKVRTEKCSFHQGAMSTGQWVGLPNDYEHAKKQGCTCDGSGWIPNDTDS